MHFRTAVLRFRWKNRITGRNKEKKEGSPDAFFHTGQTDFRNEIRLSGFFICSGLKVQFLQNLQYLFVLVPLIIGLVEYKYFFAKQREKCWGAFVSLQKG